jgi:hypothetical protein
MAMSGKLRRAWLGAGLASCLLAGLACGEEAPTAGEAAHHEPAAGEAAHHEVPSSAAKDHTMQRAGYPQDVACYAVPSETCHYIGYLVGGGAPCRGEYPCLSEGTWGWDYQGCIPRRIALGWWHGRRYQGGTGAYKAEGPHVFHCE